MSTIKLKSFDYELDLKKLFNSEIEFKEDRLILDVDPIAIKLYLLEKSVEETELLRQTLKSLDAKHPTDSVEIPITKIRESLGTYEEYTKIIGTYLQASVTQFASSAKIKVDYVATLDCSDVAKLAIIVSIHNHYKNACEDFLNRKTRLLSRMYYEGLKENRDLLN